MIIDPMHCTVTIPKKSKSDKAVGRYPQEVTIQKVSMNLEDF